jgi:hypothetical protein
LDTADDCLKVLRDALPGKAGFLVHTPWIKKGNPRIDIFQFVDFLRLWGYVLTTAATLDLIQNFFFIASCFYAAALGAVVMKRQGPGGMLLGAGCLCNGFSLAVRYWSSYPLLPLYQGVYFIPFVVGLFCVRGLYRGEGSVIHGILVVVLAGSALFFPNDFYLPFLQFKTVFAHGFFLLGVGGKALFLLAGAWAVLILGEQDRSDLVKRMGTYLVWGYFLWTLSVFSGAVWAYLGWGAPIVWEDPLLVTTMATWLYYTLFLHLHLTGLNSVRSRAIFALLGAVFVFLFNLVPELGIFMVPEIKL